MRDALHFDYLEGVMSEQLERQHHCYANTSGTNTYLHIDGDRIRICVYPTKYTWKSFAMTEHRLLGSWRGLNRATAFTRALSGVFDTYWPNPEGALRASHQH